MRDVTELRSDVVTTISYEIQELYSSGNPRPWPPTTGSYTVVAPNRLVKSRGRSDITPSDGFRPTSYSAWEFDAIPGEVSGVYEYRRYWYGYPDQDRKYTYSGRWYPGVESIAYSHLTNGVNSPIASSQLDEEADTKALLNLTDSKVNFAQNMGEIRENAMLMYESASKLSRAYRAFRRRQFSSIPKILGIRPRDLPETARDQWLSYRFGWKPLVSDIFNAREAIVTAFRPENMVFTVEGNSYSKDPINNVGHEHTVTGDLSYGVNVKYAFTVTDSWKQGLESLGLSNPAALAWELAPYSFVMDYFLGVGTFL